MSSESDRNRRSNLDGLESKSLLIQFKGPHRLSLFQSVQIKHYAVEGAIEAKAHIGFKVEGFHPKKDQICSAMLMLLTMHICSYCNGMCIWYKHNNNLRPFHYVYYYVVQQAIQKIFQQLNSVLFRYLNNCPIKVYAKTNKQWSKQSEVSLQL